MRKLGLGIVVVLLVGCGGSSSKVAGPPVDSDSDPISDPGSLTIQSATLSEVSQRSGANGISLTALSADGNVVASQNGLGPGVTSCGLATVAGVELPLPADLSGSQGILRSLSADGMSFAYAKDSHTFVVHHPDGDQTVALASNLYLTSVDYISADGQTVVGVSTDGIYEHPFRWSQAGGVLQLEQSYITDLRMFGVSADGHVAIGGGRKMRRWVDGNAADIELPASTRDSWAYAVSSDGSAVAGQFEAYATSIMGAFRWTAEGGAKRLGHYPGFTHSSANYMSADGKVIVGEVWGPAPATPYVWTSASGMKLLRDIVTTAEPTLLNPEGPVRVSGISADGKVLIGGTYSNGGWFPEHAWVAHVELN